MNDFIEDYLLEKAASNSEQLEKIASYYWNPPTQPPARTDIPDYFADGFNLTSDQYLTQLWEPLRVANSSYVTRDSLGKDASGTYDIWRYNFTPENYTKTIIIGTCLHGGEVTTMLSMYRFFLHIINDWDKYQNLSYIRNNVRIIYIPFQNPWGVSQSPRIRQNSNGVDLNRNFDYKWSDFTPTENFAFGQDYKGTAVESEVETQYIKNTLLLFNDAVAYLDLHNLGSAPANYVCYNAANSPNQYIYDNLINYLIKDISGATTVNSTTENPSAFNYAWHKLKIISGNPEWPDGKYGVVYSSVEMTKALQWYSNIILHHVSDDNFKITEPFVIENHYEVGGTTSITLPATTYAEIPQLKFLFDAPCDGVVLFNGTLTIKGTDAASQNFIQPRIGQYGTDFVYTDVQDVRNEVYCEGLVRQTIPFSAQTYVKKTEDGIGQVAVGIYAKNSAGTCTVYRYRGRILFVPSKNNNKLQVYNCSNSSSLIAEYPI